MSSVLFNKWVKEERDEAFTEGATEGATKEVVGKTIEVLITKFGIVEEELLDKIRNITSKTMLDQLFKQSLIVSSAEEFEVMVDKAIK